MKTGLVAVVLALSSLAPASIVRTVHCFNPNIQDNAFTATFRLAGSEVENSYSVKLRIPSGKFGGRVFSGVCNPGRGIPERPIPYLVCTVNTSSDTGYAVDLWAKDNSIAGSASVQILGTRGSPAPGAILSLPKCVLK